MSAAAGTPPRPNLDGSDPVAPDADPDDATARESSIRVSTDGATVVIAVERTLDVPEGDALLSAASAAVATGPERLDIDLRALEAFTDAGARALVAIRALSDQLAEGLHYRTGRGPGRDALLAAYQEADPRTDDG
ncbi:MAG TPA: hypothetical protein VF743_10060 [Acidimicrobiales bacterium]